MTDQIKNLPTEVKYVSLEQFKMSDGDDGNGAFDGHANHTGEIDDGADLIPKGAFSETIASFLESGFIAQDHNWSYNGVVAYPVDAKEDDTGFYVSGRFHSTLDAQSLRTKTVERMKAGKTVGFSIGYGLLAEPLFVYPKDYSRVLPLYIKPERLAENLAKAQKFSRIRILPKVRVKEFSFVTNPMNSLSRAASVKSKNPADEKTANPETTPDEVKGYFEAALAEDALERDSWRTYSALQTAMRKLVHDCQEGECAAPDKMLADILRGFVSEIWKQVYPLLKKPESEGSALGADAITLRGYSEPLAALHALKNPSLAGMEFKEHSETVLAAADEFAKHATAMLDAQGDWVKRMSEIYELRTKSGKKISASHRECVKKCRDMLKGLHGHADEMDKMLAVLDEADSPSDDGKSSADDVQHVEQQRQRAAQLKAKYLKSKAAIVA